MKTMTVAAVAACAICAGLLPLRAVHAQASGASMGQGMAKSQDKMTKGDSAKMHETKRSANGMAVKPDSTMRDSSKHDANPMGSKSDKMKTDKMKMDKMDGSKKKSDTTVMKDGMAMDSAKAMKKPPR